MHLFGLECLATMQKSSTTIDPNSLNVTACSNLMEVLHRRACQIPDKYAFSFLTDGEQGEVSVTYAELDRQARAIGASLRQHMAAGERALLLYPPGLEYVAGFFGCLYAGVIAVPAYPPDPSRLSRTLPRIQAILEDAQASCALTTSLVIGMSEFVFAQAPTLRSVRWLATDVDLPDDPGAWEPPNVAPETLAFLQYTSGSTGLPKGVMVSHGNLMHNSRLIAESFGHTHNSVGVIWLPPYHDMGLIGGIMQTLYCASHTVLLSPLDFLKRPARWLE